MEQAFGAYLRTQRQNASLTQRKLAELSGIDFTYISKVENGHAPVPAIGTLYRLADAVGVPVADMCAAAGRLHRDMTKQELEGHVLELLSVVEEARWYASAYPIDAPDGPRSTLIRHCNEVLGPLEAV